MLHDRPTSWACNPKNWPKGLWQGKLPSQSTMSRRLATTEVQLILHAIERQLGGLQSHGLVLAVDGKPLLVGSHSKDPDTEWGHVRRGWAKGYKFHALYGNGCIPERWELVTLNVAEPEVAARMLSSLERAGGDILGDSVYVRDPPRFLSGVGNRRDENGNSSCCLREKWRHSYSGLRALEMIGDLKTHSSYLSTKAVLCNCQFPQLHIRA